MRRWLPVLLVAALIGYGTLYPFHFTRDGADVRLWQLFAKWQWYTSRGDVLGNIALFMPFGAMWGLLARRHRHKYLTLILIGACAAAYALVLQVLQVYFPPRAASLSDVLWNSVGAVLGALGGLAFTPIRFRSFVRLSPAALSGLLLIAFWFGAQWAPFVPSLDWQAMKSHVHALFANPHIELLPLLVCTTGACVIGILLREMVPATLAMFGLIGLLVLLGIGKLIIVQQSITASMLVGCGIGFLLALAIMWMGDRGRRGIGFGLVFLVVLVKALAPFQLASEVQSLSWIPFSSWLSESMLENTRALMLSGFLYGSLIWFARGKHAVATGATILLALWVAVLELAQLVLVGHHATIDEPITVLIVGWVLRLPRALHLSEESARSREGDVPIESAPLAARDTRSVPVEWSVSPLLLIGRTFLAASAIAAACFVAVRIPGVPYNVRELFVDGGHSLAMFGFGLALLWIGSSAHWLGRLFTDTRIGFLLYPVALLAIVAVLFGLLSASVTRESIADLIGSTNLYRDVTGDNYWGERGKELFLSIHRPGLIGALESIVRLAALVAPLITLMALALALLRALKLPITPWPRLAAAAVAAVPWLWLAKLIAFDWSATDNLNELIGRTRVDKLGGGPYLYGLVALTTLLAAFWAHVRPSVRRLSAFAVMTTVCVPLSWLLLNHGVEPYINKYGKVYSGVQFLLGPDRNHQLSPAELFMRWTVVELSAIGVLALGAALWRGRAHPRTHGTGERIDASDDFARGARSPILAQGQA